MAINYSTNEPLDIAHFLDALDDGLARTGAGGEYAKTMADELRRIHQCPRAKKGGGGIPNLKDIDNGKSD